MRHYDKYLHAPVCRIGQRHHHLVIQNQVRRHDMHIGMRRVDDIQVNLLPHPLRPQGADAVRNHKAVPGLRRVGGQAVFFISLRLLFGLVPHLQEHVNKALHRRALNHDARILPVPEPDLRVDILVRQVDSPGKRRLAVYYQDLPVVAVIVMGGENGLHRGKHLAPYAFLLHKLGEIAGQVPKRVGPVVHEPHLHALPCLFLQDFQNLLQHLPPADNKEFDKDILPGLFQLLQHILILQIPQLVIFHLGILVNRAVVTALEIIRQLPHMGALRPQPFLALRPGLHIFLCILRQLLQPRIQRHCAGLHDDRPVKDRPEDRE